MSAMQPCARRAIVTLFLLLVGLTSGCAHNNPRDPLEPLNRGIYTFNDGVDRAVVKPISEGYRTVIPQFVRTGVGNFFSNLDDVTVIINGILQLKIPQAVSDTGRFVINTTIGILGLFDVATHFGLEKHSEDFGQTLGYWGIGSGPYLVLPFLGPSSLRDGIGRLVDLHTDLVWRVDHIRTRNQFYALRSVQNRSVALDSEKILDTAAIDRYTFLREAYLQRRRNLVYDGNPPPEPEDDEPAAKPRSESEPLTPSVVTDRFGNVIAGTRAATLEDKVVADQPAPKVESQRMLPTRAPKDSARSEPRASAEDASGQGASPAADPQKLVRVWLPSGGER